MGVFPRTPVGGVAWSSPSAAAAPPRRRAAANWGILGAAADDYWNDIRARHGQRVAKSSYIGMLSGLLAFACWVQLRINSVSARNFLRVFADLQMFRIFASTFTNVNLLFNP